VVATPDVWLIRHGETEWTVSRLHTGLTNLPLTAAGEEQARALRSRLQVASFARVIYSPLQRAARTCELAGYGMVAEVDKNLVESHSTSIQDMGCRQFGLAVKQNGPAELGGEWPARP
jgi:broad specificity phosphatase PhoE